MDYCAAKNQIKSYAPSSSSGTTVTLFAKNIDCVTLEADLVACDALTIQGQPISVSAVPDVIDKTQNMSAIANETTHTGNFIGADLQTTRITPIDTSTGLSLLGNSTVSGTLGVTGATTLTGAVTAASNITMSGTSAALTQSGTSATASLKATSVTTLAASGATTLSSTLGVTGATTLTGAVTAASNITMSGTSATLTQSGTSATASLKATSVTTLAASGATTLSSTLGVTGATSVTTLTASGNATVAQLTQTLPGYYYYSVTSFAVPTSAETIIKYSSTATFSQGTLTHTYSSSTGLFTNSTGSAKAYLVSYTTYFTGATGGRRACYIRTSNITGNAPQGAATTDQEGITNTAHSYQVGTDATAIKLTGCAPVILANGGSFGIYAYQTFGTLSLTGAHVLILAL
jgi:hypothetical protein